MIAVLVRVIILTTELLCLPFGLPHVRAFPWTSRFLHSLSLFCPASYLLFLSSDPKVSFLSSYSRLPFLGASRFLDRCSVSFDTPPLTPFLSGFLPFSWYPVRLPFQYLAHAHPASQGSPQTADRLSLEDIPLQVCFTCSASLSLCQGRLDQGSNPGTNPGCRVSMEP